MSFILDALRKSETDRRRAAEPILAGMPVTPGRSGAPTWVWVVIGSLAVAVIALGWAWWRSIDQAMRDGPVAAVPSGSVAAPGGSAESPPSAVSGVAERSPARQATADGRGGPVPVQSAGPSNAVAPRPDPGPGNPAAAVDASTSGVRPDEVTATARIPAGSGGAAPTGSAVADASAVAGGSNGATARVPPAATRIERGTLPTLTDIEAAGVTVPPLSLELHVYHSDPARRWVYINGSRYSEGRRLESGPMVVEIVPEGVVLNYEGRDFLLLAQ